MKIRITTDGDVVGILADGEQVAATDQKAGAVLPFNFVKLIADETTAGVEPIADEPVTEGA